MEGVVFIGGRETQVDVSDLAIVRGQPLFSNLPEGMFERLTENVQPRAYPKGRMIFQRGDPADYFYVVLDGWVKVFRHTPDGDEALLNIFSPRPPPSWVQDTPPARKWWMIAGLSHSNRSASYQRCRSIRISP